MAGPHASGNSSGAANCSSVSSGVASAFFFRGDSVFGPLGARAALWALRTWWQQGSRASTERKKAAVPRAKRVALAQTCQGGCESASANRNPDDSPFAAAHECARANNGSVDTCVEIKILRRVYATPARWRGGAGSSPLDGASTAASSSRKDLVKNYRVHPTHWLISTQVKSKAPHDGRPRAGGDA